MTLSLADGTCWCIRAGDDDAAIVVGQMAQVMEAPDEAPQSFTHEILVLTSEKRLKLNAYNLDQSIVCVVDRPTDEDMLAIAMLNVALTVATASLARGGMLVHGALVVYQDASDPNIKAGVILAGPGTVGKSTASARIPHPWLSLCDDATLVVRDAQGCYWAHPWPTWSRFFSTKGEPALGGKWRVEQAVPLRALFFLSQAELDRVEPRSPAQATAMLMEVISHLNYPITRRMSTQEAQSLRRTQFSNAEKLADETPAYTLHISLTGAFWEEIERVLPSLVPKQELPSPLKKIAFSERRGDVDDWFKDGLLHFAYHGPSMNPTLREPDLVTVQPYNGRVVRRGDVIYYRSPDEDKMVVHRVLDVNPSGAPQGCLRTRGDNNPVFDPYFLPLANVKGQAIVAQRGRRRRPIYGGWGGIVFVFWARLWQRFRSVIARFLRGVYHGLAATGLAQRVWQSWMPARLHPRIVVYQARPGKTYKLLVGRMEVGFYDYRENCWDIRWPYRLIIYEKKLPIPKNLHKQREVILERQAVLHHGE